MTRFTSVTNLPNLRPAARFYIDKELGAAYRNNDDAQRYFLDTYWQLRKNGYLRNFDFISSIIWGLDGNSMADFYGMSGLIDGADLAFNRNPEINLWTMKNGTLLRGSKFDPSTSQACLESMADISRLERGLLLECRDFKEYRTMFPKELVAIGKTHTILHTT